MYVQTEKSNTSVPFIRFPKRVWKTFFTRTQWIRYSSSLKITRGDRAVLYGQFFFLCVWFARKTKPKLLITIVLHGLHDRLLFLLIYPCFPVYSAAKFIGHETEVTYDDVFRNEKAIDTDGGGRSGCAFYTVPLYGFCRKTRPNMTDLTALTQSSGNACNHHYKVDSRVGFTGFSRDP